MQALYLNMRKDERNVVTSVMGMLWIKFASRKRGPP